MLDDEHCENTARRIAVQKDTKYCTAHPKSVLDITKKFILSIHTFSTVLFYGTLIGR